MFTLIYFIFINAAKGNWNKNESPSTHGKTCHLSRKWVRTRRKKAYTCKKRDIHRVGTDSQVRTANQVKSHYLWLAYVQQSFDVWYKGVFLWSNFKMKMIFDGEWFSIMYWPVHQIKAFFTTLIQRRFWHEIGNYFTIS